MPQPYNLTNLTKSNNIYEVGTAVNDLTEGTFALLILFTIFILVFVSTSKWGFKPALATSTFVVAGISIFIRLMGWIGDSVMFISFLLVAAAYLLMKFD